VSKWAKRISFALVLVSAAVLLFKFEETRSLTGIVRDAETRAPILGAGVSAAGSVTATDALGRFVLTIPRGKVPVRAQADGYTIAQTIVDASDLTRRDVSSDFELAANRISGSVRDSESNQPLGNLQIVAAGKTFTTNAQGTFELRAIKTGTPVVVRAPGYQPVAIVFGNQPTFNLVLVPNIVTVLVSDQYTNKPVPRAQIQMGDQTITSDADGRAILRRVRTGATVQASATGYEATPAKFVGNELSGTFNLPVALRPNTLDGTLTDAATNQPIANAAILVGNSIATTNSQGAYHIDNVPPNSSLSILAPGYLKTQVDVKGTTRRDIKLGQFQVKGIHVPFSVTPDQWRDLVDLVDKTELNTVVLDVKSEKGHIGWDSQVPLAREIKAARIGIDLKQVIAACRAKKIYCIARMPVFQDSLLAEARPALAIHYTSGAVYAENGSAWTNAFNQDVWAYNIALAKEAAAIGFDEIQFDYVRFPGRAGNIFLSADDSEETRIGAIRDFLSRAQKELHASGAFVSADVFGLTAATDEEQHLGQRLRDLASYLDYVSPMVYPDTWGEADYLLRSLGIAKCSDATKCPYDVIYNSYKRASEKTSTKVRLWLQAYPGYGNFGIAEYKLQKKAAQDAGSVGWMFWNILGNYDAKIFGPPE
jgi:hypothetical protein